MIRIGLIREGKIPADNRVALTPSQCKWIHKNSNEVRVVAQSSDLRCFSNREYTAAGVDIREDVSDCDVLLGIKEVPAEQLVPGKTYLFFSHTKKLQTHNRPLFQAMIAKGITLIDYECLEHADGQRIIGFGFFAGVVGAHNGMMAYGKRTGSYHLQRVHRQRSFRELIHTYFGIRLPSVKIAVTGSGRVAHGILEIMNLMGIIEVEPDEYLAREFEYPVFTQLKGPQLYERTVSGNYSREDFHTHFHDYRCKFLPYTRSSDILMNGIYWEQGTPRLFEWDDMIRPGFRIKTIADITDDKEGSVPCNLGDGTLNEPIYGVDLLTRTRTAPYQPQGVDVMAVGNLPNELPRDASRYFGEQLIKYVLEDLVKGGSRIIDRATMLKNGELAMEYSYMKEYAGL